MLLPLLRTLLEVLVPDKESEMPLLAAQEALYRCAPGPPAAGEHGCMCNGAAVLQLWYFSVRATLCSSSPLAVNALDT